MKRTKPVVGQVVYSLNVGNAARRTPQKLTPLKVAKVGRKLFYASESGAMDWGATPFCLEDWREKTEYCASHQLYTSEQEYLDERDADVLFRELKDKWFSVWRTNIPLEKLKAIHQILVS